MSAYLAPAFAVGYQGLTNQAGVLAGGLLYTYYAGSTSPQNTWTDSTQAVANSNPIVLNSAGRPSSEIWLQGGSTYKFVLCDSNNNQLGVWDNVAGMNDANYAGFSEWVAYGSAPSYVSATSFSVSGNQTGLLTVGRRVQYFLLGATAYGTISAVSYNSGTGNTTVSITPDSTNLNNTLYAFSYGFMSSVNTSLPITTTTVVTPAAIQSQTFTAVASSGGSSGVYTATPNPAFTSLVANQRLRVAWNASYSGAATLNVNSLGAVAIKQYNSAGSTINPVIVAGVLQDLEYNGTNWVILDPLPPSIVTISGGTIDNTPIGGSTPSTGAFTSISTQSITVTNGMQSGAF